MLNSSEYWTLEGQQEQKVGVSKIRMLKQISEYIRNDKFWNSYIQEKVEVVPIEEKMIEIRLRCLNICKEDHQKFQ